MFGGTFLQFDEKGVLCGAGSCFIVLTEWRETVSGLRGTIEAVKVLVEDES